MFNIPDAIDGLRTALRKEGVESHVQDVFDHLASCLNSSSPSIQMIQKLCTVLRQPLLSLYNLSLRSALQLSSSVLSTVLGKLCDAQDETIRAAWDATAKVILSGILDFLDQKGSDNVESDSSVWEILYRTVCEFFFLDSAQENLPFSMPLYLSAYNVLAETAARQVTVRSALRHKDVLGGERLGAAISRTRDFLLLEALLMLFARLLPPVHNTSQGKFKRLKFVKEVLGSPKLFPCSLELLDIMQKTSGTHWDDVAAQIIDALAKTDITFPQPFPIDEIDVCGRIFPQPLATDRLILDKQAFLVNIITENEDPCESLQVLYSRIRTITLDNSEQSVPKGKVAVTVYLMSPPLVTNVEMKFVGENDLHAKFLLQSNTVGRFMESLRRRGVGKLSFLNPLARDKRKRRSISIGLGLKFTNNNSSPIPPSASFGGKVQHVNQVYKTDTEDVNTSEVVSALRVGGVPLVEWNPADKSKKEEVLESAMTEGAPIATKNATLAIVQESTSVQKLTSSLYPGHFPTVEELFGDDDELSEISEFESDNVSIGKRTSAKLSMSLNHDVTSSSRIKRSAISEIGDRKEVVHGPADTRDPSLASNSPGSSSSTRIGTSPKPLLNIDNDFPNVKRLKALRDSDSRPFDRVTTIASDRKHQMGFNYNNGRRARRFTPSSDHETHSRIRTVDNIDEPPKIVGSRRKRETTKASSNAAIEVHAPPRKKIRDNEFGTEDNTVFNKTSPVDFDVLSKLESTCQATRRSARIKKKQMVMAGGARAGAMHGKTWKDTQAEGRLTRDVERKKIITVFLQDTGTKANYDMPPIPTLPSIPASIRKSPSPKMNGVPLVEIRSVKSIALETGSTQEGSKASGTLYYEQSRSSPTQVKEPLGNVDSFRQATSDLMQLKGGRSSRDVSQEREIVELPASLENGVEQVEPFQPIMESTPSTRPVTIDLTNDNSPAQEVEVSHRTRSETFNQKSRTSVETNDIIAEEPAFVSSPRHCQRNVTFASPIEYVREIKTSCVSALPHRPRSPFEGNPVSPLGSPTGCVIVKRESPDRTTTRGIIPKSKSLQAPEHDQFLEEVDIHDIVEVLDELQAVIIKGISNRFRNVRKDVQRGRDELIQQVLSKLQDMVIENAKHFNGLVRLEEDYHKNGRDITHCWEKLIDCNDELMLQFQNALKDHDRNISARIFFSNRLFLADARTIVNPRHNPDSPNQTD